MNRIADRDAPGSTPEERRSVLARELNAHDQYWREIRRVATLETLDRLGPESPRYRALIRLAKENRGRYLELVADEYAPRYST